MSWDPAWEDVYRRQPWGKYPGEDLIRFVARNFYGAPARETVRILEVGCGPGANLWFVAREGFAAYGIDGSATAIDQARGRLDAECAGWRGELWCGDFARIPAADAFFDAVIDNEAVYCNPYDDSRRIYAEMARVTRPGGKLFCRTFAAGSWGDGTGERVGRNAWRVGEGPLLDKGYSRFTSEGDIADLLQGFRVENVEMITRTLDDRRHEVKEWVIGAAKP